MAKTAATASADSLTQKIRRVARSKFQLDQLRPGQAEAIRSLVKGRDTLVIQPTGYGKSAVYQIAGMMAEGMTVIVSPLIALQQDQLDALEESAAEAAVVNSHQKTSENREILERAQTGEIDFLFLAPEQFRNPETLSALQALEISLFAIDEAHCVSQWGHDFRPHYLDLGRVIEALGHPPIVALTATASPEVRQEIVERLGMKTPQVIASGFDRPNIYLEVRHTTSKAEKEEALVDRVRWSKFPGIVYCATRKGCEQIQSALAEAGVEAVVYHAGLPAKTRASIQDQFMGGAASVIVATNAFGMGIDKPDIRFVYHADITESLDAYYQQFGRAGRDGERAEAVLFFRPEDLGIRKFQTGATLNTARIRNIASELENRGQSTMQELAEATGFSARQILNTLHKLEDTGAVRLEIDGGVSVVEGRSPLSAIQETAEQSKLRKDTVRRQLQQMQIYADLPGCRREFLLNYFGDAYQGPCGNCDNCQRAGEQDPEAAAGTRREVTIE